MSVSPDNFLQLIDQCQEIVATFNPENTLTLTHYSTPNIKLQYPEPFIASPSFIHQDIWFMHILVYQYWLWFIFIFIIVFFFVTFLCVVRWCNNRSKPRRETRGISRSKCGDLITACVPVSWATSIIVSESTDAIDYYDGFGTTELVVGVRAYQWGWEYYYPKDLDLNYNLKKNYSTFIGNSLKYEKSSNIFSNTNNLWKFYQNKNNDQIVTPSYLLLVPSDNYKIINLLNFNDIGSSKLNESNAFKKIKILSKTSDSDLFHSYSIYNKKFKTFQTLNNQFFDLESSSFSSKKQTSYTNAASFLINSSIQLDHNSLNKLIKYNFKTNLFNLKLNKTKSNFDNFFYFFNKNYFSKLTNFKNYLDLLTFVNNDSDNKKNASFNKINNVFFYKNPVNILNHRLLNSLNFTNELLYSKKNYYSFLSYNNQLNTNKHFGLTSSNQLISFADKNIKFLSNSKINDSKGNRFFNTSINEFIAKYSSTENLFELNPYSFYKTNIFKNFNVESSARLNLARICTDTPISPISSSNTFIKNKDYDNTKKALIFKGKEESSPTGFSSIYWNFYFNTINNNWRLKNQTTLSFVKDNHYLPPFALYYDYDFRNWQALELLEDAFWESSFSIYLNDEYRNVFSDINNSDTFDKSLIDFLSLNSSLTEKNEYFSDKTFSNSFNDSFVNLQKKKMPYFFQEDGFSNPYLLNNKNFSFLSLQTNFFINEDSYENFKNSSLVVTNLNYNIFNKSDIFFTKLIYSNILNTFRSDYDEFGFCVENEIPTFSFLDSNAMENNSRFTDQINIRNTAKNSIVTYNAIQKVFKTRLDEYRSNAKIDDFSNSFSKQSFVDSKRTPFESILKKNKITFFENILYNSSLKKNLSQIKFLDSSLNFSIFDFPFLLAQKSDSSRYIWFDWFSKWGFLEVQPSSSSRYAIFGMPYFNKSFEYSSGLNETLNETENYFIRIARSRKNYMTNWIYSPFMHLKNNVWFKNNNNFILNTYSFNKNNLVKIKYSLSDSNWYWTKINSFNTLSKQFNYSNSGLNTYTQSTWNPQNSIQNYYYSTSVLTDILSKREYMYRTFFLKKNSILNLPLLLTNHVNNPLLTEVKNNFNSLDFIINQTEYSRNVYYYSLNHFNFLLISSYKNYLNNFLNFSFSLNNILTYFVNSSFFLPSTNNSKTCDLFKNQYRPMKKGISNMVRLHATGAVAMPIEMRIQILASSKDVIHSWAIPSAGIKIDCVPGYSSHRVIIFLVSGIFWGQCMEVCGRYHHWMPIIIYFMKRDLFFLWCSHFIFLNSSNNFLSMNDRQNLNFSKLVSYDKTGWLTKI